MKVAHPANVLEAKVPDLSAPPGEEEMVTIMGEEMVIIMGEEMVIIMEEEMIIIIEEEMVIMGIIILTPTGYQE